LPNKIDGKVEKIGESGQLVTDISIEKLTQVPRGDDSVKIKFGGHETLGIFPASHGQPDSTMVASEGESGFVEIEIVGISLSDMLGIKIETPVAISW
jgi:S-adenosylmethionine hydrolase